MSHELYQDLQTLDELLTSLYNGKLHFFHNFGGDTIIIRAHKELFDRTVSRSELNCPRCVYKLYKAVADRYVPEKEERVQKELEPTKEIKEPEETPSQIKKQRRKRNGK